METLAIEKGVLPGGLSYVRLGDKAHTIAVFPGLADAAWDVTSADTFLIAVRNPGGSGGKITAHCAILSSGGVLRLQRGFRRASAQHDSKTFQW